MFGYFHQKNSSDKVKDNKDCSFRVFLDSKSSSLSAAQVALKVESEKWPVPNRQCYVFSNDNETKKAIEKLPKYLENAPIDLSGRCAIVVGEGLIFSVLHLLHEKNIRTLIISDIDPCIFIFIQFVRECLVNSEKQQDFLKKIFADKSPIENMVLILSLKELVKKYNDKATIFNNKKIFQSIKTAINDIRIINVYVDMFDHEAMTQFGKYLVQEKLCPIIINITNLVSWAIKYGKAELEFINMLALIQQEKQTLPIIFSGPSLNDLDKNSTSDIVSDIVVGLKELEFHFSQCNEKRIERDSALRSLHKSKIDLFVKFCIDPYFPNYQPTPFEYKYCKIDITESKESDKDNMKEVSLLLQSLNSPLIKYSLSLPEEKNILADIAIDLKEISEDSLRELLEVRNDLSLKY